MDHFYLPIISSLPQDPAYTSFLFEKSQSVQWPGPGRRSSLDALCDVCGASFHQLRQLALYRALGMSRRRMPQTAATLPASEDSLGGDHQPLKQNRWSYEQQHGGGAPLVGEGLQSTCPGGGRTRGLATVTPLPPDAQHYLEGLWRVSCRTHATVSRDEQP